MLTLFDAAGFKRRYWFAQLSLGAGAVGMVASGACASYGLFTDLLGLLVVASIALLGLGLALIVSIRCPRCRVRWVWMAWTDESLSGWHAWLVSLEICPVCQFPEPEGPEWLAPKRPG